MSDVLTADDDVMLAVQMRLVHAGDREAYRFVLERCRATFARLSQQRPSDSASPDDVVRRCLVTLHRARHTFDPERSFAAWIGAIARHHGIGPEVAPSGSRWRATAVLHDLRQRTRRGAASLEEALLPENAPET